jgi:gas vesicle protein
MFHNKLNVMRFRNNNSSLATVGIVAGIAVGAAFAVLFTTKKGKSTRSLIADKINELTRHVKASDAAKAGEKAVEDLRTHSREVADKLTAAGQQNMEPAKETIKNTGPKLRLPADDTNT